MFFFKVDFDKAYDEDEVSTKVEVLDPWICISHFSFLIVVEGLSGLFGEKDKLDFVFVNWRV